LKIRCDIFNHTNINYGDQFSCDNKVLYDLRCLWNSIYGLM